jgi:hypothetical protein
MRKEKNKILKLELARKDLLVLLLSDASLIEGSYSEV